MKVSVLGLGYVGLPLALAIDKTKKYEVFGYDTWAEKIEKINSGVCPIDDKDAREDIKSCTLVASSDEKILAGSDMFIITVPTPIDHRNQPDLRPVKSATETVVKYLKKGKNQIIILESTVNPGVCEEVMLPIIEKKSGLKGGSDFELAHCPERINPGDSNWNVGNIPRNVGALTKAGTKRVADFYRSFIAGDVNELETIKEAEATKIVENTFRDINIAYVNELAKSFDAMGINLKNVLKGASNKPFGFLAHYPGCGVGGHCIAVDPYYLIKRAKQSGFNHRFLKMARSVNNSMPMYTVKLLEDYLESSGKKISGAKVGLLGLSYKKNIADLRESPALVIRDILKSKGAKIFVFDPHALAESDCKNLDEIINKVDYLVVPTDHNEYLALNKISNKRIKAIIDGRNFLDGERIKAAGIYYKGIGC